MRKMKIKEKLDNFPHYLKSWALTFSGGLTLFCLVILTLIPFLSNDVSFVYFFLPHFSLAMIFAIFAASWDLLTGISGQISFGHAIFFGIAGYLCAYLIKYQSFSIFYSFTIGVVGAVLFSLLIGVPALRLKGPYLALGTLAFSLILLKIFLLGSLAYLFFGSEGISGLPKLAGSPILEYFIIFITMVVSFIIIIQISKSKLGTIFKSIRDDETGADASGINTTKYKIIAFIISGTFAGIAGCFYALYNTAVNPTGNFGTVISFFAILMASLGGLTTISGSALGAFFFIFLEYILIELGAEIYVQVIFAFILILVVRFAERGILRPVVERIKDVWDFLLGR
ncbi:MAG: branched-chain amino acid ABC transporter permease [Promethearchaeota archaeon]